MKRTSMKRTEFKRSRKEGPSVEKPERPLIPASLKPLRMGVYGGTTSCQPVAKECASQSPAYQNAVRALGYCMLCRKSCRPQFCHADQGKGTAIKTDVRRGWPGCAECHYLVGTSGQYPKERRRALEADLALRTREAVRAAGLWPARLAIWEEACA